MHCLIFVIITFIIYGHISMFRYYHHLKKKIIYSFQTTILYISKLDIVYLILI